VRAVHLEAGQRGRARGAGLLVLATVVLGACGAPAGDAEDPAPPAGIENTVRWTTASEVDNYGFDVYRSTAEDGPFEVINAETIAGAGTIDVPREYRYVDRAIAPDTAYFYYVESISMDGRRERVTPVIRSRPKPAAE